MDGRDKTKARTSHSRGSKLHNDLLCHWAMFAPNQTWVDENRGRNMTFSCRSMFLARSAHMHPPNQQDLCTHI